MTKLTYKIITTNNDTICVPTYTEAVKVKQENLGSRLVSCYEPIPEKRAVFLSEKKKQMRVKAR